ncbi:putative bpb/poz domain containing protein [Operophtera brumata]|uniref:Putative bpb/poz domain containing protein n=1 Tax=Operophtera brumata TaxID=104452 RepID=A0A0L7LGI8_OPEBR|nr:putative bpb/poz domain containing protein [Operophtera brumata]
MTVVTNPACISDTPTPTECTPSEEEFDNEYVEEEEEQLTICRDYLYDPPPDAAGLYNNELKSDIVFVAGLGDDQWRFPGHRRVLAATSPVFAAMLKANTTDTITIDYVDRRGFEQLLRYLYCEPTILNSVMSARVTLDAAYKFLCPSLAERCARRLDEMLDAGVALEILRDMRYMCAQLPGAASAPPLHMFENDHASRLLGQCSQWCDSLAHNTLLVIDKEADATLKDERFNELAYEDLGLIVRRETLRVSSEMVIIEALSRWATAMCQRYKKELTSANKRAALGELSYCPRYLLLSPGHELDQALAMELLEPMERALVIARARSLSAPVPVGSAQENLLRHWARERPRMPAALPVFLSERTRPEPEPEMEPSKLCGRKRKPKKIKQPNFAPEDPKKEGCCSCFGDGLLRALICLFD